MTCADLTGQLPLMNTKTQGMRRGYRRSAHPGLFCHALSGLAYVAYLALSSYYTSYIIFKIYPNNKPIFDIILNTLPFRTQE